VAVATVATILAGARLFGIRRLKTAEDRQRAAQLVAGFDENDGIRSRPFFWFAAVMFVLFIATLAATSVLPVIRDLDMGYVALGFAYIMLLRYKNDVDRFYKAIDWDLLLFFASLFVIIGVMEHARVLALIGRGIGALAGLGDLTGSAALLVSSAVASSVTDNIPLAAVLARILAAMPHPEPALWWAVVFGANLGGNITPIGSASTVVAVTIMHKHDLGMGFGRFVRVAIPFAAIQIALAVVYVLVFVH
jgi:Na+/H+ antiporter NhaD/arsenite permease-like protein